MVPVSIFGFFVALFIAFGLLLPAVGLAVTTTIAIIGILYGYVSVSGSNSEGGIWGIVLAIGCGLGLVAQWIAFFVARS